jgi:hypothetical protein
VPGVRMLTHTFSSRPASIAKLWGIRPVIMLRDGKLDLLEHTRQFQAQTAQALPFRPRFLLPGSLLAYRFIPLRV